MRYSAWLTAAEREPPGRSSLARLRERLRLLAGRLAGRASLPVALRDALHERRPRVARARRLVGGLAAPAPLLVGSHDLDERLDHRVLVVGRHEPAGLAVVDDRRR